MQDGTSPGPTVVAGHLCLDLLPRLHHAPSLVPGELADVGGLTVRAGGCVANTGLALADLGARVRLAADIGRDDLGLLLGRLLHHPRADTGGVRFVHGGCSYSVVVQPPGADRSFWHHVGANAGFDAATVDLDGAGLVHLGYPAALPALHRDGGIRLRRVLTRARADGVTTSVDLSTFAATSPAACEDWPRLLARALPSVDVMAASLDDLDCALRGEDDRPHDPRSRARDLVAGGAAVALVKAGTDGLHLATGDGRRLAAAGRALAPLGRDWAGHELRASSIPVDVVSTAGAGDAAVAGLLFGIRAGMPPEDALATAARAAAARVSRHGGLPGWRDLPGTADVVAAPARRHAGTAADGETGDGSADGGAPDTPSAEPSAEWTGPGRTP